MPATATPDDVGAALVGGVSRLIRRFRQIKAEGPLTAPESSALGRLDREGPATSSEIARLEQISPQSMGATFAALESRGLVTRRADPEDGRRIRLSVSAAGAELLNERRNERAERLSRALAESFSPDELAILMAAAPLIERLATTL